MITANFLYFSVFFYRIYKIHFLQMKIYIGLALMSLINSIYFYSLDMLNIDRDECHILSILASFHKREKAN